MGRQCGPSAPAQDGQSMPPSLVVVPGSRGPAGTPWRAGATWSLRSAPPVWSLGSEVGKMWPEGLVGSSPPSVTQLRPGGTCCQEEGHSKHQWGRRAQLFGAGDGLRNRHCSPWISACFLSLLDFSCALVLSWYRLLGVSELKATETRPGFTHSILDAGARWALGLSSP